jgi:hypothetical protein
MKNPLAKVAIASPGMPPAAQEAPGKHAPAPSPYEIAAGGGAQARFWRVYGRYAARKSRGETRSLDDHLEFALAAYDAGRLPAEAVTCLALFLIDRKDVDPRVQKAYSQDFHERYEAIRRAFGLGVLFLP